MFESRELTALDFCLWGWIKSKVYRTKIDTRDDLLARILDVATRIKICEDQIRRSTRHLSTQVAKCTDVDGGVFEHLL